MDPKQTIKKNLERRSETVDIMEEFKGVPKPTWVELSLIDVCNRKCIFCPKADESVAPDTFQKMGESIINQIHDQLKEIEFNGTISLCGYGEPLLHKDIIKIVKKLSKVSSVEIVTNGDVLSSKSMQNLYLANTSKVLISMYDGPHQIEKFKKMTKDANVPEDFIILRDRWHDKYNDFGVKLTNRAGTISVGEQEAVDKTKSCFYPTYQFLIDWNGNIYLCPQDWQRRVPMGNVMQESIYNIWIGKILSKFRKNLLSGKRCASPCNNCNADGKLLGKNHAKKWKNIYKI
jgi:radical SAM protein with 4Fe4S-binding SPASM domain